MAPSHASSESDDAAPNAMASSLAGLPVRAQQPSNTAQANDQSDEAAHVSANKVQSGQLKDFLDLAVSYCRQSQPWAHARKP